MNEQVEILQLGNPVLAQIASPVENIMSDATQQTIDMMLTTVAKAGGVGIAAPQINISQRIFIMCSKPNKRYPEAPLMQPTAIINPEIITTSKEQEKDWEGCLSVPSIRGLVPRYKTIKVSYFDLQGNKHNKELSGFLARIFQHEIDHLDGLTFIDRVESVQDLCSETEWYKQYVNVEK
ncbi:peptide deformylase [Pseudocolwellia agarivorans]|uniref:peptide deformylase n=1 Tax=Pseudocolwellia agarivorans TaxID=1911682 RepID=UPI0009872581|nr:peptide deformylase [Pseudocolwellia agarivorans]